MEALVSEWHDALRFYHADRVAMAWRTWRNSNKFFPHICEILSVLRDEAPAVRPAPQPIEPKEPFCQNGRTEAEEIAHRAAVVLNAKRKYGYTTRYSAPDETALAPPIPASQEGLSPAFIELAKRQGIYRPTATPNQEQTT